MKRPPSELVAEVEYGCTGGGGGEGEGVQALELQPVQFQPAFINEPPAHPGLIKMSDGGAERTNKGGGVHHLLRARLLHHRPSLDEERV